MVYFSSVFFFSSSVTNASLIRNHALDPALTENVIVRASSIANWSRVTSTAQKLCVVVIRALDFAEKYVPQSAHLALK